MERRALLKGLVAAGIPAAAAAATLTARTASNVRDKADVSIDALRAQVESLKARFEKSDIQSKKLMRVAIVLAALSLGLDVTSLF
jgi:uncharacterized membrane-anchored protein